MTMIRNLCRKRLWLELTIIVGSLSVIGFPARIDAQVVGATLSGTITDASGAVLPNAQVSIKNSANGSVRSIATNAAGLYTAPNLLPGDYVVSASAAGFAAEATNVTLTVGAQLGCQSIPEMGCAHSGNTTRPPR